MPQATTTPLRRSLLGLAASVLLLAGAASCSDSSTNDGGVKRAGDAAELAVKVISTRANLVTDGDARIEITGTSVGDAQEVALTLDGKDLAVELVPAKDGGLQGVVTGLAEGSNALKVETGGQTAELKITNNPIGGPLFSGPQIKPWTCGPGAVDDQCNQAAQRSFLAYSVAPDACQADGALTPVAITGPAVIGGTPLARGCFVPYDTTTPQSDIATVVDKTGKKRPFVILYEQLWQNRDQVFVAQLADPTQPLDALDNEATWNGSMLITQTGACGGHHGEATSDSSGTDADGAASVLDLRALADGVLVMTTALNSNFHNCNGVLQAESLTMAKEYVIDHYGPIDYTFGYGCSGGSMSQLQVANGYPGIYQGLITSCTFPDPLSAGMDVSDCVLFLRYFSEHPGWSDAQQNAVTGKDSTSVCDSWVNQLPFWKTMLPTVPPTVTAAGGLALDFQNCGVPAADVYDPKTNPDGIRCSLFDFSVNILGTDPATGFAYRPLDNAGVQYGLKALNDGVITPQQFVELNAAMGGFDPDFGWQQQRTRAAEQGLINAYRAGAVNEATNLDQVAIIDRPMYAGDIHEPYRSYALRGRINAAHGSHNNMIIWDTTGTTPDAYELMVKWLSAATAAGGADGPPSAKAIVEAKPDEAVDIIDRKTGIGSREAAGGPSTADLLACQLTAPERDSYPATLTDEQWDTLRATFPDGVCDWTRPGIGQEPTIAWLDYTDGPGGKPLG